MEVHKYLGPGFYEIVYKESAFAQSGIFFLISIVLASFALVIIALYFFIFIRSKIRIRRDSVGPTVTDKFTGTLSKKGYILVIVSFLVLLPSAFYMYNYKHPELVLRSEKSIFPRGNTLGNIANKAFIAYQEDRIYYSNIERLLKSKIDGSGEKVLSNDNALYINVQGEWVYYSVIEGNPGIFKIRVNGEGREKLYFGKARNLNVIEETVYFTVKEEPSTFQWDSRATGVYKMDLRDRNINKISDDNAVSMMVAEDWIYFNTSADNSETGIMKMKTDGTGRTKISDILADKIVVENENIFYSIKSDKKQDYGIFKIKDDGRNPVQIVSEEVGGFNVQKGWIYYTNKNKDAIYKVSSDGGEIVKLIDHDVRDINILNEWIYYNTGESKKDYAIYKIKNDGSYQQRVY